MEDMRRKDEEMRRIKEETRRVKEDNAREQIEILKDHLKETRRWNEDSSVMGRLRVHRSRVTAVRRSTRTLA